MDATHDQPDPGGIVIQAQNAVWYKVPKIGQGQGKNYRLLDQGFVEPG